MNLKFDNMITPACDVPSDCDEGQYKNADDECVDCFTPQVSLSAFGLDVVGGEVLSPIGQPVEFHYNSIVPDIDSSVVTLEYNAEVQTLTRNLNGVFMFTPEFSMTFTIRAVTDCGTVTQELDVTLVENPACLCPEGVPACLQLTKEEPWAFTDACAPITDGPGDANLWDGKMQLLSPCRWGVEFTEAEDGIGGVFINTSDFGAQFKAIIELISCDPFVYEMTFYTRANISGTVVEFPFWKGRCVGNPVGNYVTQHYGVGVVDGYCYADTDFEVEGCFDEPCTQPEIRFDPPSGSTVNFPTLVFLHSTNNNDLIFYRINDGEFQAYTMPFSVQAEDTIDAYSVTFEGCLGDTFSAEYISDTGLEFAFICDGPNDKAGVFDVFTPNGVTNDYHWRIKLTRGLDWELNKAIIYETDAQGVWVTGQAWATLNPIFPIELEPDPFAVYPLVLFENDAQINIAYGDPVTELSAGEHTLHGYGQPAVALSGYFRLELTLTEDGGSPITIYKLIPHSCDECPDTAPTVGLDADCEGNITVTATLQVGSTYRIYRAEFAPCGADVYEILDEFIATATDWERDDTGTNGCTYGYLFTVYCQKTTQWIPGQASFVVVPPPCDLPESFCNATPIIIPTFDRASPYPSEITVTGRSGTVVRAMVEIFGYRHQFPDDVEILLVGPDGTAVLLMNDCGGYGANQILAPGVNLLFSDAAAGYLPDQTKISAGTFKPTAYGTGYLGGTGDGTFLLPPAPAPSPVFSVLLSSFVGKPCNGVWKLFVNDDQGGDSGAISGGWCLYLPLA